MKCSSNVTMKNTKFNNRTYFYLKMTYSNLACPMEHVYQNKSPLMYIGLN